MEKDLNKITNDFTDILDIAIPEDIATLQLPDPSLLMYYKNLSDRIIWIDRDIDSSLLEECKQIIRWNIEDKDVLLENRRPIYIFIQSYGGTLDSTFAMLDVMEMSKTKIITVNINTAMSAGCLLFINGHERYCTKLSTALIHEGSGGNQGTFSQVEAQQANYKKMIEMMKSNIMSHTNIDLKTYNKYKVKEWYLYAEDQVKYGLADKIIDSIYDVM